MKIICMVGAAGVELSRVLTARKLLILGIANGQKGPVTRSIVRLLYELIFRSDSHAKPCSDHSIPLFAGTDRENKAIEFLATTVPAAIPRGRNSDFAQAIARPLPRSCPYVRDSRPLDRGRFCRD